MAERAGACVHVAMATVFAESITLYEPEVARNYSIDFVAHCTGVPRHRIAVYCRSGLITTEGDPARVGWRFGPKGIRDLRRAEEVRERIGDNPAAIKFVLALIREVEELQRELRAARGGW